VLSNRELAPLILLAVLVSVSMFRNDVRIAAWWVLRSFLHWRIQAVIAAYVIFIAGAVWIAHATGLWRGSLLKDTILWFVLSGLPLVFRVNEAGRDPRFFNHSLIDIFRVGALFAFAVNLSSLSLIGELILQSLLAVLVGMRVVASRDAKYKNTLTLIDVLLGIIALAMVFYTGVDLYQQWNTLDLTTLILQLLMSFWLPLVSLVFVFGLALVAGYELAFKRMAFAGVQSSRTSMQAKLALLIALNVHLVDVNTFAGGWGARAKSAPTISQAIKEARGFRQYRAARREQERREAERHRQNAGVQGTDPEGRQLDRREFAATQDALRWIATCQMGWYRNRSGSYRPDLMLILSDLSTHGIHGEHGITLRVRADGQAWYAWRRAVTGWVFGIGAASKAPDQWFFDGPDPPSDFPSAEAGWDHFVPGSSSLNWS